MTLRSKSAATWCCWGTLAPPGSAWRIQQRLDRPDYARLVQSLGEVRFCTAMGRPATYAGQGRALKGWLATAQINRDRNLRLQFRAVRNPDLQGGFCIYDDLLPYRGYPESLFVPSGANRTAPRRAMRLAKGR